VRWEPHPGWPSTAFAVLAAWCLSHRPSTRWLVSSGLATAAAYLFKQNTGLLMLLAIVAWNVRRAHIPSAAFAAFTLVWLIPLVVALHGDVGQLGVLIGRVNSASLFSPPEAPVLIAVACLLGGLWLVRTQSDRRIKWYLLAGTALFLTELPRVDALHLAWSAPLLLVVGAAALDRARAPFVAAVLIAVCALVAPTVQSRFATLQLPRAPIAGVEAPIQTAADLQGVVSDVQQRTAAGEPIFVYPSSPLLYVLTERPNPTRFDHLNPGAASPPQIEQIIADLSMAEVRLVVVSDYWRAVWGPPGPNLRLEAWLNDRYTHEVARYGAYRVLMSGL
jgi:hypothetical protein